MEPEDLKELAAELGKVINNNAEPQSYIVVWVFLVLLFFLIPLLLKLIKTINTNQRIMDLHIDELKHTQEKAREQGEQLDRLDEELGKTKLQVRANTTSIGFLKK